MYIPHAFRWEDGAGKIAFMQRYSFATLVTCVNERPVATQLPFMVYEKEQQLWLSSHLAAANEQAAHLAGQTALVIFSQPHAYISPIHYNKRESVPTWDYLAVHAYGEARIITEEAGKMAVLEKMIDCYDQPYREQWNTLPDKFKTGMLNELTAFEIAVTELQGQQKLSQNKTTEERSRIITHLEHSSDSTEQELAGYIRNIPS